MARSSAIILIAAALVRAVPGPGAAAADLLLVERPGQLVLLDRYQQTMPLPARRAVTPFQPIVVRNASATLGDGVTPCMSVEIAGERAYVLLDEAGAPAGRNAAGFFRLIRGAELTSDTVELMTPALFLTPDQGTSRRLPAGERLVTFFRTGEQVYVRRPGGGFGWIPASRNGWRSLRRSLPAISSAPRPETGIIRNSLVSANQVFASLFTGLGVRPAPGGPPRWAIDEGNEEIRCVLTRLDPGWGENVFAGSTEMLARELQTLLLGRRMSVSSVPGVITIRYLNGAHETR